MIGEIRGRAFAMIGRLRGRRIYLLEKIFFFAEECPQLARGGAAQEEIMQGSTILDIVLGLFFIFFLGSIVCSAIQERIAAGMRNRARDLETALYNMLGEKHGDDFMGHPLIRSLCKNAGSSPSYIPASLFSQTLIEILRDANKAEFSSEGIRNSINAIQSEDLKKSLLLYFDQAHGNLEKFRSGIEGWFDASMDRATGWYKRRVHSILLALAVGLCAVLNIDTVEIVQRMASNKALATLAASAATQAVKSGTTTELNAAYTNLATYAIGWQEGWPQMEKAITSQGFFQVIFTGLMKVIGVSISAFAMSLGAPFWFDLMGKVSNLRSNGKMPEKATN